MEIIRYSKRKYSHFAVILCMAFLLMPCFAFADSDDLQEEIDEAKSEGKKEVKLGNGTYNGNATLGKGMKLIGKDRSRVIITGKVTMGDNTKLEKLTIKSGSVYVKSGADATIQNIVIKNSSRNAIETYGTGKLKVKNSKIHGASGKGMYIQAGKNVEITGNEIYKNKEEGIDIRSNVDGMISGNAVYSNGESGIEVILGKSELSIDGNTIKSNGSSGIAVQFYEIANAMGDVKIKNNKITKNKKYGIDCNTPSKTKTFTITYWNRSMSLAMNTFSGNNISDINSACGVDNSSSINNDSQGQKSQSVQNSEDMDMSDEQKNKENNEKMEEERKNQEVKIKLENIKSEFTQSKEKTKQNMKDIKNRSPLELFFFGPKNKELSELKKENSKLKSYTDKVRELAEQGEDGNNFFFAMQLSKNMKQEIENQNKVISNQEAKPSLFKWFRNIFKIN